MVCRVLLISVVSQSTDVKKVGHISSVQWLDLTVMHYHTGDDSWLIIHSDGMNNTTSRGGGGGIDNDDLASMCQKNGMVKS